MFREIDMSQSKKLSTPHISHHLRTTVVQSDDLVSIITPTYNCQDFIAQTLDSVAAQKYHNWEHIIVDDGSSDATVSIVKRYMKIDPRIKLHILSVNSGPAIARNHAINLASGRFIAFLDADDLWHPEKLNIQITFMLDNKVNFSYSNFSVIDESGYTLYEQKCPQTVSYHQLLRNNCIGCLTAVFDASFFGYAKMPIIRKRQDFGLWLSLLKRTDAAVGIPISLAQYRLRSESVSSNKLDAARYTWSLYRSHEKLSFVSALLFFCMYSISGIAKTVKRRFLKLV
jgi:teichuronic acid biosynthesis glycosyltransferase TuaG